MYSETSLRGNWILWGAGTGIASKNERTETRAAIQLTDDAEWTCFRNTCDALHEVETMEVGGSEVGVARDGRLLDTKAKEGRRGDEKHHRASYVVR